MAKKLRKVQRPNPFGYPHYPAWDFYISHNTVQVISLRGNAALYGCDFEKFKRWLEQVKKYADYEMGKYL